jgi:hypothetical protein
MVGAKGHMKSPLEGIKMCLAVCRVFCIGYLLGFAHVTLLYCFNKNQATLLYIWSFYTILVRRGRCTIAAARHEAQPLRRQIMRRTGIVPKSSCVK